jgi:methyl-accepting chemotaxis protein
VCLCLTHNGQTVRIGMAEFNYMQVTMNTFSRRWSGLGLQLKMQILIQGFMLVVLLATQFWVSNQIETRGLHAAEDRTAAVADGVINALNTLMSAKVEDHDVIDDPKVRDLFIRKMGASEGVKELRVIRGKGVVDEFGPGLPNQKPVDDMDRDVLANGKAMYKMESNGKGEDTLRAVIPYLAYKSFRGSNCLGCHGVNEGSVLGAISITSDIHEDKEDIRRITALLWVGQIVVQVALFFVIGFIVRRQLSELGAEPSQATQLAQRVAEGDLRTPIQVKANDTHSMMAQLGLMQSSLSKLVARVRNGSEGVAVASQEIAEGNNDLSARTEQQAAALEETASSMEQLGATVRQNADSAREASQLALSATEVAERGGSVVGQVVSTMRGINDSSHQISAIISVIDGIAFQTNILALNAAVEAARAGEQGRGFAVVATEVRSLAGRSATAAKEIKGLIQTSLDKVEQGTELVDRAGATMNEVVESIKRVSDIMASITTASNEQANGVAQVGQAITQMDEATQQNAALVEEMAAAASSLNNLAQELVQTVAVFKLAGDSNLMRLQ